MKPFLVTSEISTPLNGELPQEIMYFPAGQHTLHPSVNGEAKQVSVNVSQATADLLQSELDQLLTENVRPFIDFDHQGRTAAAIPKRFVWKPEGVMLELDWTGAGKSAVGGRDYSYFSPTFLLSDEGEPAGLPKSGAIGALTNNPAFRQIKRIHAHVAPVGAFATFEGYFDENEQMIYWGKDLETIGDTSTVQGNQTEMTEEEVRALQAELATVQAENTTLKAKKTDVELDVLRAENKALREAAETQRVESVNREAELLIESAVRDHKLAPKNDTVKASLKKWFLVDPDGAKAHIESLPANPAFKTVVNVSAGHREIGKPAPVQDTSVNGSNNGKICRSKVMEVQAANKGMTFEDAWKYCEGRFPELFNDAN